MVDRRLVLKTEVQIIGSSSTTRTPAFAPAKFRPTTCFSAQQRGQCRIKRILNLVNMGHVRPRIYTCARLHGERCARSPYEGAIGSHLDWVLGTRHGQREMVDRAVLGVDGIDTTLRQERFLRERSYSPRRALSRGFWGQRLPFPQFGSAVALLLFPIRVRAARGSSGGTPSPRMVLKEKTLGNRSGSGSGLGEAALALFEARSRTTAPQGWPVPGDAPVGTGSST